MVQETVFTQITSQVQFVVLAGIHQNICRDPAGSKEFISSSILFPAVESDISGKHKVYLSHKDSNFPFLVCSWHLIFSCIRTVSV